MSGRTDGIGGQHIAAVIGKDMRPGNIWENRELPALKNNPNIDPKTKISTVIFQR